MAFDFRLRARAPPQAAEHEHERCLPELQLHKFSYHEGFEDAAPRVELWAHNGQSQVHFLGPTVEQAFEGKKSFKLDVVIASGSYHYWGLPVRVPCAGRLKLSARMLVAEGNSAGVGFGTNFVFPPTQHSGCGAVESFSKPTGQWRRIECDLIYSIYYRATLSRDGQPTVSSEAKSEEQYRAEMADLKAHGILYPRQPGWGRSTPPVTSMACVPRSWRESCN
jgi:hypothetical protein